MIGWLVDWLIGWLIGWLVDWLVGLVGYRNINQPKSYCNIWGGGGGKKLILEFSKDALMIDETWGIVFKTSCGVRVWVNITYIWMHG